MEIVMRVIMLIIKNRGMGYIRGRMEIIMMGSGRMIVLRDMERRCLELIFMMGSLRMGKDMGWGS